MTDGLCQAVTRQVLLSKPRKDGSCLYEHFEQVAKVKGEWPEDYAPLSPPQFTEHIWNTFWELRKCGREGFSGPLRLCFTEIDSWERVRGIRLENFVLDMILSMDDAYLTEWHKK